MGYCTDIHFEVFGVHSSATDAQRFFGDLLDPTNYMKRVLSNSSTYDWTDYSQHVGYSMLPWGAFFCFSLLMTVLSAAFLLYRFCCRRSQKGQSTTTRPTLYCVSLVLFLSVAITACAAASIAVIDTFYEGVQQSECASYRLTHDILDGNVQRGGEFIGLDNSQAEVDGVHSDFQNYPTDTDENWQNSEFIENDSTVLPSAVKNYNSEVGGDHYLPNPDPQQHSGLLIVYSGQVFEQCIAGLNSDVGNVITVNSYLSGIKAGTEDMKPTIESVINDLNSTNSVLSSYNSGMSTLQSNLNSWFLSHSDTIETVWGVLTGVYGLVVIVGMSSALLTVGVVLMNSGRRGKCYYPLWGVMVVVSLGAAGLASVLVAASVIMKDACGVSDNLSTSSGLQEYDYLIPSDAYTLLNYCFNMDGDLANMLGITTQVSSFGNDMAAAQKALADSALIDLSLPSLEQNFAYISLYHGTDFDAMVAGDQKPSAALATLNSWANANGTDSQQATKGHCTSPTYDTWILSDSDQCSGSRVAPSSPTSNLGKSCCLVLPEWSFDSVSARYSPYLQCQYTDPQQHTIPEIIAEYQSAFSNMMTAAEELYQLFDTPFSALNDTLRTEGGKTESLLRDTRQFLDKYETPVEQVMELANEMNCAFLIDDYQAANTALCKNVLPSLFITMILTTVISLCSLGIFLLALVLARRLRLLEDTRLLEEQYQTMNSELKSD